MLMDVYNIKKWPQDGPRDPRNAPTIAPRHVTRESCGYLASCDARLSSRPRAAPWSPGQPGPRCAMTMTTTVTMVSMTMTDEEKRRSERMLGWLSAACRQQQGLASGLGVELGSAGAQPLLLLWFLHPTPYTLHHPGWCS